MTTDTTTDTDTTEALPPIPQAFADAAEQAGLKLIRNEDGVLELSDERGHGMLITPDFEHQPLFCAVAIADFKKRFVRDDVDEQDAAGEDDDDDETITDEDDDEGEVQFKRRHPFPDEDFQEFREQVERLTLDAQDFCAEVQDGTSRLPIRWGLSAI